MLPRLAVVVSFLLAVVVHAQQVAYEKYKLDNGMTVILHEDHSLPVVTINTWYRVGAKEEAAGRSGFAHLFEHLMFMGTERVPGNQFDVLMENGGGNNNASTSFDRTNYFSNGPASLLPTLLWLDADRLEDLGRTMTQEKLDKQRNVVRNERRQVIENAPYQKAELLITSIMFPQGHPYHNEVIGTHEDLEAATVNDVKDFFATFYVPNNASLVVAGDFDPKVIKPLVQQLFGTIRPGQDPVHKTAPPVKLDRVVTATTLDAVQVPKIAFAYHSPSIYAEGDAEMDLVGAVLSQGKSSRLYKRLVLDEKLATDVSAYQSSNMIQSTFRIDVMVQPGADLERVERIVDEEVNRLRDKGPTKAELDQRVATIEMGKLAQLQSVQAKADKLNEYEFYFGNPDSFKRDLDRYRNATPRGVQEWARRVLTPDARLIVHILPEQPVRGATPRDQRPQDLSDKAFNPQKPQTFTLKNGVNVQFWARRELPLVAAQIVSVPGGPLDTPELAGRSALAAQMMEEGTINHTATQFSDLLQSYGATFSTYAANESAGCSLLVLKRNFDKAMSLVADAVQRPRMEGADWERVVRLQLEAIKEHDDDPRILAGRVGQRVLFGDGNPYAWPLSGTPRTVRSLTLDQVKAHHRTLFSPAHTTILIAGDLTVEDAKATLEKHFGGWEGNPAPRPRLSDLAAPQREQMQVVIVDRPGAVQTVIRFLTPGVPYTSKDRVQRQLLNELFGGGFTSRINQNLREDKGYTYGAASSFVMQPSTGYFIASSSVRADVTGAALGEFLKEFERIHKGDITPEEAAKAMESQRVETVRGFSGLSGVLAAAGQLVAVGLPFETIASDMQAMRRVTAADLNTLARPATPISHGVLVLVGDKATILPQLKDLNLPAPVEYTIDGEPKN
ncbi:MAG TPA: pitrilysin family protein [Phycisphaerales bacterium]|nr:pitrilysin family protein [Phycisphaerales bacterium]